VFVTCKYQILYLTSLFHIIIQKTKPIREAAYFRSNAIDRLVLNK
jgi:hypothetical protein